jgi:hypothetical protein
MRFAGGRTTVGRAELRRPEPHATRELLSLEEEQGRVEQGRDEGVGLRLPEDKEQGSCCRPPRFEARFVNSSAPRLDPLGKKAVEGGGLPQEELRAGSESTTSRTSMNGKGTA